MVCARLVLAMVLMVVCTTGTYRSVAENPHRPILHTYPALLLTYQHTQCSLHAFFRTVPRLSCYRIGWKKGSKKFWTKSEVQRGRFGNLTNVPAVCTIFEVIPFSKFSNYFSISVASKLVQFLWSCGIAELWNCRCSSESAELKGRHSVLLKQIEIISSRSSKISLCVNTKVLEVFELLCLPL